MRCLWDTDVLSLFLRQSNPHVARRAAVYLARYRRATFSRLTRYEVLRGLKARNATTQLGRFEAICTHHQILSITDAILVVAADL